MSNNDRAGIEPESTAANLRAAENREARRRRRDADRDCDAEHAARGALLRTLGQPRKPL